MLSQDIEGSSWTTMYSVQSRWEATRRRKTVPSKYMWRIWLRCFKSTLNSVEKRILCFVRVENCFFKTSFPKLEYGVHSNMSRRSDYGDNGVSWEPKRVDWEWQRERKAICGLVKLFSDQTATKLKSTDLTVSPVHAVLLTVCARRKTSLTNNGHTLVQFLLMGCSQK